jgi:two-component system catabolic regulation response regulator CreB
MPPLRQTILVVEDESAIADTLVYALQTEGFAVVWKTTGREAIAALGAQDIALVVLDVGLPDLSGFDVCREIRRRGATPIIFLTARSAEIDRIVGLELGGDDYVPKPFSPRELTARVRAILRRANATPQSVASGNDAPADWQLDEGRCRICYRGEALELTRNEYRLLCAFLKSPGRVFSREQLMAAAWDDPGAALDRTVDAHVKTLRAKLRVVGGDGDGDPIVTHRGLGYSLKET